MKKGTIEKLDELQSKAQIVFVYGMLIFMGLAVAFFSVLGAIRFVNGKL
jgi:hypothetical protein